MQIQSNIFLYPLAVVLLACLPFSSFSATSNKDTLSVEERNKERRDLNILLNLPEESRVTPTLKPSVDPGAQECAISYQKGTFLYNQAVKEYELGNFKKALELFQAVLEVFPLHKSAYDYIIQTLKAIRQEENPDRQVQAADKAASSRNDELFQNGLNEFLKQNYTAAGKIWSGIVQVSPDYGKAFEYLRKAQDKVDEIAQNFLDQGVYYYQKGDVPRAVSEWEKGLALCPDNDKLKIQLDAARNQSKILLEQILGEGEKRIAEKKYGEALKIFASGLEKFPNAKSLKDKYSETSALCEKTVTEKYNQAKVLFDSGKYGDALSLLRAANQISPEFLPVQELLKRTEERMAGVFKRAASTDIFKEAAALADKGQYFEAIDRLREIEKEDAAFPGLQDKIKAVLAGINGVEARKKTASGFNKGLDLFNSGYYQSALKEWRAIQKDTPDDEMIKQYITEAEKLAKTSVDRQKIKNQQETDAIKLNQAGMDQYKKKNLKEAYKNFEKAVETDPENPALRKTLKSCKKDMIKEQEKLTPESEKKVENLFLEGINFYRDGQYKKAIECWKQVISAKPDHKKAQTYILNVTQKLQKIESI